MEENSFIYLFIHPTVCLCQAPESELVTHRSTRPLSAGGPRLIIAIAGVHVIAMRCSSTRKEGLINVAWVIRLVLRLAFEVLWRPLEEYQVGM